MEPKYNQVCYHDLRTKDIAGAAQFYNSIVGWDKKHDEKMNWTHWVKGEQMLGGFMDGQPAAWIAYFQVDSLEAYATKIQSNGGKAVVNVTTVPEHGRYSVWADPFGAEFALWETNKEAMAKWKAKAEEDEAKAKKTRGRGKKKEEKYEPFSWHELQTEAHNSAATSAFYTAVFGWKTEEKTMPVGEGNTTTTVYTSFRVPDAPEGTPAVGGMMIMRPEDGTPPGNRWLCYISTDDVEGTTAKAEEHKAQVLVKPTVMKDIGAFSVFIDPTGVLAALYCPESKMKAGSKRKAPAASKKAAAPKKSPAKKQKKGDDMVTEATTDGAAAPADAAANGDAMQAEQ